MSDDFSDIPSIALGWHRGGQGAVLATVVETWGSAPRPVGSQLAIRGDGAFQGSVSGGCVEGAVVIEAQEALANGKPRVLSFGVSDDEAFAAGLACGGTIRVLLEPVGAAMDDALLAEIVTRRAARDPVAYVVDLATWDRRLDGPADWPERFRADRSGVEPGGGPFVAIHNPPLRLIVVGAVHIAQALIPMARLAGFDVTLIDPRDAFGSAARFPDQPVLHDYADDIDLALDTRSALVTLGHDPRIDDPALIAALNSRAFYIGALGSTRTHAKRVGRLKAAGFPDGDIARIRAPVGLDIGAQSPAEIAVAVMAEMIAALRQA